ncbi:hypothetical protein D3C73_1591550 [compost metagenome]
MYYSEGVSEPEYDMFTTLLYWSVVANAACFYEEELDVNVEGLCNEIVFFEAERRLHV